MWSYDDLTDLLCVYYDEDFLVGAEVSPAPADNHILLTRMKNPPNRVICVEVMGAKALIPDKWLTHPDRPLIPNDLLQEIDVWVEQRAKESRLEKAKVRLQTALSHLRYAVKMASQEGNPQLAVVALADKGGQMTATFEVKDFLADLETVIEAPPETPESEEEAAAAYILSRFGAPET